MSGGEAEKEVVIFLVGVCQVDPRLFSPRREGVKQEEKNSLCARPPAPGPPTEDGVGKRSATRGREVVRKVEMKIWEVLGIYTKGQMAVVRLPKLS